jgi:SAM-dependent methyltransferase
MSKTEIPSYAETGPDGRMYAPAAARNIEAISAVLAEHAPETGLALEIASGTGEHVAELARRLPGLTWQPTDPAPDRRVSIDAHGRDLKNTLTALNLDATAPGWAAQHNGLDLIFLSNLLHLIPEQGAKNLIAEVAQALAPGGRFILYGPFLRDGETTSDGDERFNASLIAQDPDIGYKDDWDVIDWIHENWMELVQVIEMPANNLCFVVKSPESIGISQKLIRIKVPAFQA